ncbi:MAG: hypothetical protein WBB37_06970 [bacterium]
MMQLPDFLKEYFWDTKFEELDIATHQIFILKRIMEHGNDRAVKWMRRHFQPKDLIKALCNYRGYSKRSANFWAIILDIPKEDVPCLNKSSSKTPKNIWPY